MAKSSSKKSALEQPPEVVQVAPDWMPDAIPTELGWKDPRTGEIILGIVGLVTSEEVTTEVPIN